MTSLNRRDFLAALGGSASLMATGGQKLNFVFILMDDLGWTDAGYNGSDFYETPNIDRFSRQGMKFTSGYAACPVCSPTRASIISGKYPARLHLTNFIPGRSPRKYAKLVPPEFEQQLPLEEVTIAEALKKGGYTSASIGKWHLGGRDFYPGKQGFDLSFVTNGSHIYPRWKVDPPFQVHGQEQRYVRETEEAEQFIEKNKGNPFFLYLPYHLVHIPLESIQERIAKYEAKLNTPKFRARKDAAGPSQNNPVYAAMVEEMDIGVGRVLKKLEDAGIAGRTVVFYMSDNGGLTAREFQDRAVTSNAPLREGKGFTYEGGIREPWLVRWPDVTKPGSVCDVPVTSVDFYPTILDMAGVKDEPGHITDGESIVPLLRRNGKLRREAIYWHYPHYSNQGGDPSGAVRKGDYKLIEFYEDRRVELYDLKNDIGERNNLAAKMPAKAEEMRKMLHAWLEEVSAAMPTPNPNYDEARQLEGLRWVKK